jgi:hypothetical protein
MDLANLVQNFQVAALERGIAWLSACSVIGHYHLQGFLHASSRVDRSVALAGVERF